MITVKEFKNLFNNIYDEDIRFFVKSNIELVCLDLVSYEVNNDDLDKVIRTYTLKPIYDQPNILNSLTNIKDIFINGKNDYDLLEFNIINDDCNLLEIKVNNIFKEKDFIIVEFEI